MINYNEIFILNKKIHLSLLLKQIYNIMIKRWLIYSLLGVSLNIYAQDVNTHVFFANQSELPVTLSVSLSGQTASVEIRKTDFLPFEITHDHNSTISIGDIFGIPEKDHNENNSTLNCTRQKNNGANNFSARVEVKTGNDLLFTIVVDATDIQGNQYVKIFYNIEYPDGTLDQPNPGIELQDNKGTNPRLAQNITYNGNVYRIVYGVFDENQDATDNIIFSISNISNNKYRYDPPISDTSNPNVLNMYCYNPGILMPVNISDQDENERAVVFHKAMPKNMDFIVFEEFFEPQKTDIILNNLKPWYPYHTGQHNKVLIPFVGKEGGVRIVSKYPILEEKEISFIENGCIPEDFFSKFANKGVKYAKINKHGQIIHIFGTHTSEQPCDLYVMGKFIASFDIPKEDIVVMAGDFNVDMNSFDPQTNVDVYTIMLDTLNALEPTYLSFLNDRTYSGTSSGLNHFYCCNPEDRQHLDYIFVSSQHKIPTLLTNRSMQARLNESDESFGIFDMGDHEPIYARAEFPAISTENNKQEACIGNSVVLTTTVISSATDGYFKWYKDGEEILEQNTNTLSINILSSQDFGIYSCEYLYTYLPDTIINNHFDAAYMHYNWQFRGIAQGKLIRTFEITPKDTTQDCMGNITSTHLSKLEDFMLYPNPGNEYIVVSSSNLAEFYTLDLIDIYGITLKSIKGEALSGKLRINVKDFPSGVYFVRGYNQYGSATKSFLKIE